MKRAFAVLGSVLAGCLAVSALGAFGRNAVDGRVYEVTVTNLTPGQIFSPVLAAVHDDSVDVFEPGQPASPELATLAEEGMAMPLANHLMMESGVSSVATGSGMLHPGESVTLTVRALGRAQRLTVASMLVSTNDTFAGLDGVPLPPNGDVVLYANGWDAGSEANSESCKFIPGPPCGAAGAHDPSPAEGFVTISNGIHGIGDLDPSQFDWRNPVAQVRIHRLP